MTERIDAGSDITSFIHHAAHPLTQKNKTKKTGFSRIFSSEKTQLSEAERVEKELLLAGAETLQELFDAVFNAGRVLVEKQNYSAALRYRVHVRRFLELAVPRAYDVQTQESEFSIARRKRYALLRQINTSVAKMIEGIRIGQHKELTLLEQVGMINGMLIDMMS